MLFSSIYPDNIFCYAPVLDTFGYSLKAMIDGQLLVKLQLK